MIRSARFSLGARAPAIAETLLASETPREPARSCNYHYCPPRSPRRSRVHRCLIEHRRGSAPQVGCYFDAWMADGCVLGRVMAAGAQGTFDIKRAPRVVARNQSGVLGSRYWCD